MRMRIVAIRERAIRLSGNVANAVVSFAEHDVSLVAVVSDVVREGRAVTGIAFDSIGRFAQSGIIRERLIPRVLAAVPDDLVAEDGTIDPARVAAAAMRNEKPGGHGDRAAAVAAIELACWDLRAKLLDEPAYLTIGRWSGHTPSSRVAAYAAGGYYYATDSEQRLIDELRAYEQLGFTAYKIKIGGADLATDGRRIEAALSVAGEGSALAVDANARFDIATALAYAKMLAPYEVRWFEEPVDPLDYAGLASIIEGYHGAVATGENIFSRRDVANLARYGRCRAELDVFQMDAGLSYGLTEYGGMIAEIEAAGFARTRAFPHGGHLINLHIVAGMGLGGCEVYPHVFAPFGGFSPACTVDAGNATPSDAPGFGLEEKTELRPHILELCA
jgi:L-alanine-DL-glutamate epimerase-like enolase superfamily enzyme